MNIGKRKTLPNCNELSFSSSIKYDVKAFNQSILRTWFSKPQPSVRIITCVWWNGACIHSSQCCNQICANCFKYRLGWVKLWQVCFEFTEVAKVFTRHPFTPYNVLSKNLKIKTNQMFNNNTITYIISTGQTTHTPSGSEKPAGQNLEACKTDNTLTQKCIMKSNLEESIWIEEALTFQLHVYMHASQNIMTFPARRFFSLLDFRIHSWNVNHTWKRPRKSPKCRNYKIYCVPLKNN